MIDYIHKSRKTEWQNNVNLFEVIIWFLKIVFGNLSYLFFNEPS